MKPITLLLFLFLLSVPAVTFGQVESCVPVPTPRLSEETQKDFENKLAIAKAEYLKDTSNADNIIWYGRRTAYLGNYEEAIRIFTKGIAMHPSDARLYRHRGHRYITVRCFDKAIIDFKTAARLVKGRPDEIEPDGLPNARNIPTSTLQSNIWYHLGLTYYLLADYKQAAKAYRKGLELSKSPDMYVATANWLYITLRKIDQRKKAAILLATIKPDIELIENKDYLAILMLHKSAPDFSDPVKYLQENKQGLGLASFGYGLGNYLLLEGDKENAKKMFTLITSSNQWAAFGYIAAEAALKKLDR